MTNCDLNMPHDMRYNVTDPRHHPPNCPAQAELVPSPMTDVAWRREVGRFNGLMARLATAEQRIELAQRALIATGYFTAEQVGEDIAPRITELWSWVTDGG